MIKYAIWTEEEGTEGETAPPTERDPRHPMGEKHNLPDNVRVDLVDWDIEGHYETEYYVRCIVHGVMEDDSPFSFATEMYVTGARTYNSIEAFN